MTTTTRRCSISTIIVALALTSVGCGGDEPRSAGAGEEAPADDASATDENAVAEQPPDATGASAPGAAGATGVFTPEIDTLLDVDEVVEVPGGGLAAAGFVCRGGGGDLAYVGASGVEDDVYVVSSDGVPGDIMFRTGSPTSGRGVGAHQGTFEDESYTFAFMELDVEVTIPGCS